MFRRYCPPSSNIAAVSCPSEQHFVASISVVAARGVLAPMSSMFPVGHATNPSSAGVSYVTCHPDGSNLVQESTGPVVLAPTTPSCCGSTCPTHGGKGSYPRALVEQRTLPYPSHSAWSQAQSLLHADRPVCRSSSAALVGRKADHQQARTITQRSLREPVALSESSH
jgi:hypothetical protein